MKKIFFYLLILSINSFAQLESIQRFPLQNESINVSHSLILQSHNNELLYFTLEADSIFLSRSIDKGLTWANKIFLIKSYAANDFGHPFNKINGVVTPSSRIVFSYRDEEYGYSIISSDDNGYSWTEPSILEGGGFWDQTIAQINDSTIWILFKSGSDLYYLESQDDANTWAPRKFLIKDSGGSALLSIDDNSKMLFNYNFKKRSFTMYSSFDGGQTWPDSNVIFTSQNYQDYMSISSIKTFDNKLHLIFDMRYYDRRYGHSDVLIISSDDNGQSWSEPIILTSYLGNNFLPRAVLIDEDIYINFISDRYEKYQSWYGILGKSRDSNAPPNIIDISHIPEIPLPASELIIKTKVIDTDEITQVSLYYKYEDQFITIYMEDEGILNENLRNDSIYVGKIPANLDAQTLTYFIEATDSENHITKSIDSVFIYKDQLLFDSYLLDINNFELPFNNNGVIADVRINEKDGGRIQGSTVLFSSGFGLSGYDDGNIWSNGVMTASRVDDYLEGPISNILDSNYYKIYVQNSNSLPFNNSWNTWSKAVELGASFYDGNGDDKYEPIDFNENKIWDLNEDKPYLLGDVSAWCIFNDSKPISERNFNGAEPKGIEIKQTLFAYAHYTYSELANVIFVKYKIENKGIVNDEFDSVYFSFWSDPDVVYYGNDLMGSDSTLNLGYIYNSAPYRYEDYSLHCFTNLLLQGPVSYLPKKSFVDNNQNGEFDPAIDIALDTAVIKHGPLIQSEYFPGAQNLKMTSAIHYMKSHPTQGDADDELQFRNYLMGKNQGGYYIDPCDWEFGTIFDIDCNDVDPIFMYSGNPLLNSGWINTNPTDQRLMVNTGPFQLEVDKPIEIIGAYIVGKGLDRLDAITEAKKTARDVIAFYESNFTEIPVYVEKTEIVQIPSKFVLEQNYPNPFNPVTTIQYSIPAGVNSEYSIVKMAVFDVLGREVETLVNEIQKPGNYEFTFNAGKYASGVYYYQLKAGDYIQTKKMILLK